MMLNGTDQTMLLEVPRHIINVFQKGWLIVSDIYLTKIVSKIEILKSLRI